MDKELSPREVVQFWISYFNKKDINALAGLYEEEAINHQVNTEPVKGRAAIRNMFEEEFAKAEMVCIPENIFEEGNWAILEWKDPLGLRGCGFFNIEKGKIKFQRGYWDKLSFLKIHGLPFPEL
jgi:hypothetical protein